MHLKSSINHYEGYSVPGHDHLFLQPLHFWWQLFDSFLTEFWLSLTIFASHIDANPSFLQDEWCVAVSCGKVRMLLSRAEWTGCILVYLGCWTRQHWADTAGDHSTQHTPHHCYIHLSYSDTLVWMWSSWLTPAWHTALHAQTWLLQLIILMG